MRRIYYCSLLISCLFLSGCAMLFTSQRKVVLKPQTNGVDISANKSLEDKSSMPNVTGQGATFHFYNGMDNYLVTQKKPGFRASTTVLYPSKFNKVKLIDIGLPLISDVLLLGGNTVQAPVFYMGTLGWLLPLWGPRRIYENSYNLPPLVAYPQRDSTQRYLIVDKISLKSLKDSLRWTYYESYRQYERGEKIYSTKSTEDIMLNDLIFSENLNHLLVKFGYADTVKKMLTNSFNSYRINCEITGMQQRTIGSVYSLELHSKWKIMDQVDDKVVVGSFINATSNYTFYEVGNKDILKTHTEDALEASLVKFLNLPDVKKQLNSMERSFVNKAQAWDLLTISTGNNFALGINAATKAVVTIKTSNGHGSGCVITPDGYIVTCYHVTGESNENLEIVTENGTQCKARLVRYNPLFDLALIKVDSVTFEPLKLQSGKSVELATEVYAIGTPGDVDLGQTLTKGIISGKRKIDNKIYIQTDVSINKGNSGGALIDKTGILLGIVNAKIVGLGVEGIGFAIPVNYLEEALKIKLENK